MSKLDYALLIITGLVAISGYIEGFVLGACATLGLLGGAAVGVWGVPRILDNFSPSVSETLLQGYLHSEPTHDLKQLTPRERQIVKLVAEGKSNKVIASVLNLASLRAVAA